MKKSIALLTFVLPVLFSCENTLIQECNDVIKASVSVDPFVLHTSVKSSFQDKIDRQFESGDTIGVFSHNTGSELCQNTPQLPFVLKGRDAEFSSATGWSLFDDGSYRYVSYFPFSGDSRHDCIHLDYSRQMQRTNGGHDHIQFVDYLYSSPVLPQNKYGASFSMHHISSVVKMVIIVPAKYSSYKFSSLRLRSENPDFLATGNYSVGSVVQDGGPCVEGAAFKKKFEMGLDNIMTKNNVLTVYMALYPTQIAGELMELSLTASDGSDSAVFSSDVQFTQDLQPGNLYEIITAVDVPVKPVPPEPDEYNVLLVANSYGVDCMEYVPALLVGAGINNVRVARFYISGGTLEDHWNKFKSNTGVSYGYANPGDSKLSSTSKTLANAIKEIKWDLVIFQPLSRTDTSYSYVQPFFDSLRVNVCSISKRVHNSEPEIGWDLVWDHDNGAHPDRGLEMYNANVGITKRIMANTGISFVLPLGTAFQNLYNTSLNQPGNNYFKRDRYFHASYGIGRYLVACTFFESVIKPQFGISVLGNPYIPETYSTNLGEIDKVTAENKLLIQKCAVAAAENKLSITYVEGK